MDKAHTIEAAPIENRYARGWHCLGLADSFRDGQSHRLDIFGRRLEARRGADGAIHIADGRRRGRPARNRTWTCREHNRLLFIWHDPEGNPPSAGAALPDLDAILDSGWSDWHVVTWVVQSNCRELVDTLSDIAHFLPVHGAPVAYFANILEGQTATQIMVGASPRLADASRLTAHSSYFGPATHFTHMTGEMQGLPVESVLLNAHVPIDLHSFELRFGVKIKRIAGLDDEQNRRITEAYVKAAQEAFQEDVVIWESKTRVDNPVLCQNDGPLYQLRDWYRQFYLDAAQVPERLSGRQVFEIGHVADPPPLRHVFQ